MKKLLLMLCLSLLAICMLTVFVSAAATNEFGTVETSDSIDLTGMSTDTKARVVLFDGNEYHTYPAQYIVTDKGDITLNFDKINAAFGKSYSTANNSVIRIEIPNTVKVIVSGVFNYGKNNSLKEVIFPADTSVYKLNWGSFEENKGLEKINLPATLTELQGTNHFAKCSSLKTVTFDEGYSLHYLPANFFQSCSSLEELILPNCITELRGGTFSTCSNLKKVVFGASLETMLGAMSDCSTKAPATWYLPATFYGEDVESTPPSNMFHWAGNNNDGVSGNKNHPQNITFVYTGTKAQAIALRERFKKADASVGENCVGLKRLYDAILCTPEEYEQLTGSKVGEGASGYYFVYGYNLCDAFYGGEHAEGEVLNSCQFGCGRGCGLTELLENPQHDLALNVAFGEKGYFSSSVITKVCSVCSTETVNESVEAMFTWYGYSVCTYTDTLSITQAYGINKNAIEEYEKFSSGFSFGILATVNTEGTEFVPDFNSQNVISHEMTYVANDYITVKVTGIPASCGNTFVVLCLYITDGEGVYFLEGGTSSSKATGVSYNTASDLSK